MRFDPADLVVFPVFVLSVVVHECAHGLAALWLGDTTARDRGRLTLNPIPHLDLVGSILLAGRAAAPRAPFLFGWAKPVPVNWANLRDPRNDPVKVALAGPASNFLLAIGFAALVRIAPESGFWAPLRAHGLRRGAVELRARALQPDPDSAARRLVGVDALPAAPPHRRAPSVPHAGPGAGRAPDELTRRLAGPAPRAAEIRGARLPHLGRRAAGGGV